MSYPDNFETPAFPAGKRIAISRAMAIWTLVMCLVIVFLCGILIWSARSERLVPFLISVNNNTGEWAIVGKHDGIIKAPVAQTMQESVVVRFMQDWFRISGSAAANNNTWKKCERNDCSTESSLISGARPCAIYCLAGEDLFSRFVNSVLPNYELQFESGDAWELNKDNILVSPIGKISEMGGTWHVTATVSTTTGDMAIRAFVKVARNNANYPQTIGFYIADFNAYRID